MAGRRSKNKGDKQEAALLGLEEMCKSGDNNQAYEALQMYRSRANRFKHKNDYENAIMVSSRGAVALASNGYDSAALELCMGIVESLEHEKMTLDNLIRNTLNQIDDAFTVGSKSRSSYLKALIKWDRSFGSRALGDPMLHCKLAFNLWENDDTKLQAAHHFAQAEAPDRFATKLAGVENEKFRDKIMTLGLLHFLAVENLRDANELFSRYIKTTTHKDSKLLTFCDYLLQTCRRDAAPLYQRLIQTYANELNFDDSIPNLVKGPIASIYFGIKDQRSNPMMQAILGGLQG